MVSAHDAAELLAATRFVPCTSPGSPSNSYVWRVTRHATCSASYGTVCHMGVVLESTSPGSLGSSGAKERAASCAK